MNILHVSPAYPPASGYGGGPKVCQELSENLSRFGNNVSVFTTNIDDQGTTLSLGSTRIHEVNVRRFPVTSNWAAFNLKFFHSSELNTALNEKLHQFDIVHIHDYRTPITVAVISAAQDTDTSVVLQPHGTIPVKNRFSKVKRTFDWLYGDRIRRSVSKFLSLNETESQALTEIGVPERRCSILPNGISPSSIPNPSDDRFRKLYGIDANESLVLYLGRLHDSKRVDLLINAYKKSNLENPHLVIVGPDDGAETKLRRKAKNMDKPIQFTGRVSEERKWEALHDADLFATPSYYGFPLTFLEAMYMQTPILATVEGDRLDQFSGDFFVQSKATVEHFSRQLERMLSQSNLGELGQEAKSVVKHQYNWEAVAKSLQDEYEEVLR